MISPGNEFERRRMRLVRAGELLFGPRYQHQLAALLDVAQPSVAVVAGGKRELSADLEDKLGEVCLAQAENLTRRAMALAKLAVEIAGDRRRFRHIQMRPPGSEQEEEITGQPENPPPKIGRRPPATKSK